MKLAAFLEREKIGVREFAARIGLTSEAVRLYIVGKRVPRPKQMAAIAAATGGNVRPNDFFPSDAAAGAAAIPAPRPKRKRAA